MLVSRFHPHLGGVERHVWNLCGELSSRGHQVTVCTIKYDQALPEIEKIAINDHLITVVRCRGRKQFYLQSISRIFSANIVHCHDFFIFIQWYLPLRFLLPFKRVFVTFHGWEGVSPPVTKIIWLRRLTELLTYGNMCVGDFICKWYGTKADCITYGGVRTNASPQAGSGAIFVGRLAHDTGIMIYLQAISILKKRGLELPLTVCGDGPMREDCEHFAQQHSINVIFKGNVETPSVFVSQANFVFATGYLAILEAMVATKLVFSVYDTAIKEDYLKMIPCSSEKLLIAGNASELAEQLQTHIEHRNLGMPLIECAFKWASVHTWKKLADQYVSLWRSKGDT